MQKKKKTLLDLDRIPTLDELRAYFREENDFSAAAYIDMDYDKLDSESVEMLEHTRSKVETVSLSEMESAVNDEGESTLVQVADSTVNVEDEVIANLTGDNFWDSITEDDRALLRMRMSGKTQQDIADALGYNTHSAVTKRLQKLKEIFENSDI